MASSGQIMLSQTHNNDQKLFLLLGIAIFFYRNFFLPVKKNLQAVILRDC